MGRTHVLLGIDSALILTALPLGLDLNSAVPCILAAALGALLPDLDAPSSLLQNISVAGIRPFRVLALGVAPLGHRGPLHSRTGLGLVALLAIPILIYAPWVWLALLLGYASHLASDACTRGGIRWRYPRPEKLHLLPTKLRLVTGSPPEDVVFALAACAALFLLVRLVVPASIANYQ